MRRPLPLLFVLAAWALLALPAGAAAAAAERTPTPVRYTYDLALDYRAGTLAGTGAVELRNDGAAPLTEAWLRLWPNALRGGGAAMADVAVSGGRTASLQASKTAARVQWDTPVQPGESATISFTVRVKLPARPDRTGTGFDGAKYFGNALPTLSVREDGRWHLPPYVSGGESFYTLTSAWQVRITTGRHVQLATTGVLTDAPAGGATVARTFEALRSRDFAIVAMKGRHVSTARGAGGATVRVYSNRRPRDGDVSAIRAAAKRSLDAFSRQYAPYPDAELDVVMNADVVGGGGMEYPGLVLVGPGGGTYVTVHEVAHQWFYSLVGNDQYRHPWLDEAVSEFATVEYLGASEDSPGFAQFRRTMPPIHAPMSKFSASPFNYAITVYWNGPAALDRVRDEVGNAAFKRGLRTYVTRHAHGVAVPADFVAAMSEATGRDQTARFRKYQLVP